MGKRNTTYRRPVALGIPWSEIERRLIDGMSMRDIAADLGCSVQNVHERIQRRRRDLEKSATPAGTGAATGASTASGTRS